MGLLLAFSRFCSNGHPVLLWPICRVGSIGSICTFFQKRRSQVSSAGDLLARLCQKLLLGQRKQRKPYFSWKAFSISWAMRASWSSVLLCFRYPVCVGDSIFRSSKKDINLLLITRQTNRQRKRQYCHKIQHTLHFSFQLRTTSVPLYPIHTPFIVKNASPLLYDSYARSKVTSRHRTLDLQ